MLKAANRVFLFFLLLNSSVISLAQPAFVENKGQWNPKVLFQFAYGNRVVFLEQDGFTLLEADTTVWNKLAHHGHENEKLKKQKEPELIKYHVTKLQFAGSNSNHTFTGQQPNAHYQNYFIGSDPTKWASHVKSFASVLYPDFYPGIDVRFMATGTGLKYDFIIHPGADYRLIQWQYLGADALEFDEAKITVKTSVGDLIERIPEIYQLSDAGNLKLKGTYKRNHDMFGFSLDALNEKETTVIDPELIFCTYAGNTVDNFGFTATYDQHGNLYSGGISTSPDMLFDPNGRYPATPGAFSTTFNGGEDLGDQFNNYTFQLPWDITLSKYSSDGTTLMYATYLGGASNEFPHSIIVDHLDQLVVMGTTFSPNYPTSLSAFQKLRNGMSDILITKFSADGSSLIGSTLLGGNMNDGLNLAPQLKFFYADEFRGEVQIDNAGNVYGASSTYSYNFPITAFNIQKTNKGGQDGVVFKLNEDLSSLIWSTYLGGAQDDALYNIDFDSKGIVYVSGGARSNNMPGTSGGAQAAFAGGVSDGYLAAISQDGTKLLKATYWGTNNYDQIFGLELDNNSKVYIVGQTKGKMAIKGNVYNVPNSGQFITRFSNDLKQVEFNTLFGSGDGLPDITINAFMVADCKNIFVSGWGGGQNSGGSSTTYGLPTKNPLQPNTDGNDFYIIILSKDARELLFASCFGGNKTDDHVDGGTSRFDKKGVIYQSVCASCPDLGQHKISDMPTTKGAYSEKNHSPRCSNAAFKIALGNLNRPPRLRDTFFEVTALDTVLFSYKVSDPDEDTIYVHYTPLLNAAQRLKLYDPIDSGFQKVTSYFSLIASCSDALGDTLVVNAWAQDHGCPDYKDSSATIRIKVNPPPPIAPPKTICLNFISEDSLRLSWDETVSSQYFEYLILYKIDPTGKLSAIDTFRSQSAGMYLDTKVKFPKTSNYTYFLIAQNKCGLMGDTSIKVSSTQEYEFPITPTYIVTATVTNKEEVLVQWLHSTEEDFGSYDVYKKLNGTKADFEYLLTLEGLYDTFYFDKDVNVQEQSYCYAIVVTDNCGHISKKSNKGCTVVLKGLEEPFQFPLYWNEYEDWAGKVLSYTIERCVDTGTLRPIVQTNYYELNYLDSDLDYDWGGYWYRVKAQEGPGSLDAVSNSNKIYLIQPPLLHVPNAFTPNYDNLNEKWGIVPVFVKEYHLQVFNRWGEKVYDTENKKHIWDGYNLEEITSNNVYIYYIRFTGWDRSVHYRKGTVTILK